MQIAIIPARGGSKRIPRKNIKLFGMRPMIVWPITAALESGLFDDVIVSTDDDEIAEVAEAAGASAPFRRPAHLSDDMSPARGVINHAIANAETRHGCSVATVCCLYATAALVLSQDLIAARTALLTGTTPGFVFGAVSYAHPVQRAMHTQPSGGVEMMYPEYARARSQDLEETFHDAGMFYWGHRDAFMDELPMFAPHSQPFLIPRERAQDVDTPEDWAFAEALLSVSQAAMKQT